MTHPPDQQPDERSQQDFTGEEMVDQTNGPDEQASQEPLLGVPASSDPILGETVPSEPILGQPAVETTVAVYEETVPETIPPVEPKPPTVADAIRSRDPAAISEILERGARMLFATSIFLVPIVFDPRTIDAFNLAKLTTLWFFGVLAIAAAWLSAHIVGRRLSFPRSRLVHLAILILGVTALATLFSPNRTLSIFGLYHRYEGLVSIALYVAAVVVMFVLYRRRPGRLGEIATAIAAAGGVAGAYVILQRFGVDVTEWRQASGGAPRFPIGPLGNSAFTASFLGISAPFIVYRAATTRVFTRRVVWAIVLLIPLLGLWFTGGRSGMLAAGAGILALPLFTSRVAPLRKLALVLLALVALVVTPLLFGDPTDPQETQVLRTGTAGYRAQIWDASFRMFTNRPILGWGPETFYGNYPRFRRADEARRTGLAITDKPHSVYLGWATSTGIVGFAAYLLLFGTALTLVARRASKLDHTKRLLAAAFGAGLVAYLVQGVYSIDVPPLFLMAWICVGGIAVLLDRTRGAGADAEPQDEAEAAPAGTRRPMASGPWLRRRWVAPTVAGLIALALIVVGFGPLRADHAAWAGERRASLGWSTDTLELYEKAIALNPREAAYRGVAGSYMERIAGNRAAPFGAETALRRSAAYYLQALDLQPRNVYFMINVARVYTRLGKDVNEEFFELGDSWMGQAVSLDPLNPQMRDLYTDLLNQWQEELSGSSRREILDRARTQAGIAQQIRAGRTVIR